MADSTFELHHFTYHAESRADRALTQQVDEMAISNMLAVLNNPVLRSMLNEEELRIILETVKTHVAIKAKLIHEVQGSKIQSMDVGKSFK